MIFNYLTSTTPPPSSKQQTIIIVLNIKKNHTNYLKIDFINNLLQFLNNLNYST